MALSDFNPNFVSTKFPDSALRDFPHDEVIRRLDGEDDPQPDSSYLEPVRVLKMFLEWIAEHKAKDSRAINYIGKRAIAAAWVVNPKTFDGAPAHMVAKTFGISPLKFSHVTAEFSRKFKVKNQFQAHDSKN